MDTVDFYYYVDHVLPFEWNAQSATAAYQAGALAVKSFAWHFIESGVPHETAGCTGKSPTPDLSDQNQKYNDVVIDDQAKYPQYYFPNSQSAVRATSSEVLLNIGNTVLRAEYRAGRYCDDRADSPYSLGKTISQEGSRWFADSPGKTGDCGVSVSPARPWQRNQILTAYYNKLGTNGTGIVNIAKTTPREIRHFHVSSVTNNSITLSWDGYPGDLDYAVGKWNGSQWVYSYPGTGSCSGNNFKDCQWTDTSVQSGVWYSYTVFAGNVEGWGRAAFDAGWLTASTHYGDTASSPPSYDVHFISNNQIRFTLSKPGATQFEAKKKLSNGTWQVLNSHSSRNYEFRDTGLTSGTTYEYAGRAFVNGSWTEWTNGGTFTVKTYSTR